MPGIYLLALLVGIGGLMILDHKFKLAFFYKPRQTAITLTAAVLLFIIWDFIGIKFDIFYTGPSNLLTGWQLAPHFPIEEIGFLILLNYNALLAWVWLRSRNV